MVTKSRAIILLITLFFISAISILILKNLSDSEKFFNVIQSSTNLIQTNITSNNIKSEIMELFKKEKNNIDIVFDFLPEFLPLEFENIKLKLKVSRLNEDDYYNLNDSNLSKNVDNFFNKNINFSYDFFQLIKNKKIKNKKQINYIVNNYINITKDDKILNIQDKLTYLDFNDTNATYVSCKYDIDISGLKSHVDMIFKAGDLEPLSFNFYFKDYND